MVFVKNKLQFELLSILGYKISHLIYITNTKLEK